jgi:hypothetical protein
LEPIEEQKHNEFFVAMLIELHKSKSVELFVSNLSQIYGHQNYNEQIKVIVAFLTGKQNMILRTKSRFSDLTWRLNAKICSRTVEQINSMNPRVTIEITKNNLEVFNTEKIFMQSTPSVLNHLIQKLEQAFIDSKNVTRKLN